MRESNAAIEAASSPEAQSLRRAYLASPAAQRDMPWPLFRLEFTHVFAQAADLPDAERVFGQIGMTCGHEMLRRFIARAQRLVREASEL